jgi:cell division protein YceG involved in septum cleavage
MYTTQPYLSYSVPNGRNRSHRGRIARHVSRDRIGARRSVRKAIRLFLLLAAIAVSFLCGTLMNVYAFDREEQVDQAAQHTVYVASGDTLWNIASQYKSDSQDIREYVYSIKKANHLTSSSLQAGQTLILP